MFRSNVGMRNRPECFGIFVMAKHRLFRSLVLSMAYSAILEIMPFDLELAKHRLQNLDYGNDSFALSRHLQIIYMFGHGSDKLQPSGFRRVLHDQLGVHSAGYQ